MSGAPPSPRATRAGKAVASGYTVLETLSVLLVLSILFGFLLTAITALRKAGERRQAMTDAVALALAVQDYRRVYGSWPGYEAAAGETNDVVLADNAQTNVIADLLDNPRGFDFIELPPAAATNRMFLDPWGNPYLVAMDTSEDGDLSIDRFGIGLIPNTTVGVLSQGSDGNPETAPIRSWEVHHAR